MAFKIQAACGCNIGRRRTNNEDNFYFDNRLLPKENRGLKTAVMIEQPLEREQCYGVFDGMGGESYGEEASFLAAQTAKEHQKILAGCFVCAVVRHSAILQLTAEGTVKLQIFL